jgi:DNA-binding XRE family transcriptional regulator
MMAKSGLFFSELKGIIIFDSMILKVYQITFILSIYCNMASESNIGKNIKKHRTKLGLSQEDFAQKSGVKYTTLTKIESGVIKTPSVLMVEKIAKALGVSIEDLLK